MYKSITNIYEKEFETNSNNSIVRLLHRLIIDIYNQSCLLTYYIFLYSYLYLYKVKCTRSISISTDIDPHSGHSPCMYMYVCKNVV